MIHVQYYNACKYTEDTPLYYHSMKELVSFIYICYLNKLLLPFRMSARLKGEHNRMKITQKIPKLFNQDNDTKPDFHYYK